MLLNRFLFGAVALLLSKAALTRDGAFDRSFGAGGIAELLPPNTGVRPLAMTIDGQGRALVAGAYSDTDGIHGFVLRLLPNGQPDPTFAGDGWFVMPHIPQLGFAAGIRTVFRAIEVKPGGIYVAGYPKVSQNGTCGLVVALTDSGTLRTDFGTAGTGAVCGPAGLPQGEAGTTDRHLPRVGLIVTDEQILISIVRIHGFAYPFPTAQWLYALTLTGTADTRFGNQGLITFDGGFLASGLALDNQGRLVVGGGNNGGFAFQRRSLPTGTLDNGFGVLGTATIAIPNYGFYPEIGETWVMAGDRPTFSFRNYRDLQGEQGSWNYGFLRTTADGSPDGSVANHPQGSSPGYVAHATLLANEPTGFFDTAATPDPFGRVLVAGPELVRLQPDGNLDAGFGTAGYVDLPQPPTESGPTTIQFVQQSMAADRAGNAFVATAEFGGSSQTAFRVVKIVGDTLGASGFE